MRRIITIFVLFLYLGASFSAFRMLSTLPPVLKESSGLLYIKPYLWTLVDSTNTDLYALSPRTGKVVKRVRVLGIQNHDWESIARDAHFLYIGDVGNNAGDRTNLVIYRLPLSRLTRFASVRPRKINVNYFSYTPRFQPYSHDFDAEALLVTDDKILIVTKNWRSGGATIYQLPKSPGRHEALLWGRLHFPGMVTAASLYKSGVSLLAYQPMLFSFQVTLRQWAWHDQRDMWQSRPLLQMNLPIYCQAEGLAQSEKTYWLTCEGGGGDPAKLFVSSVGG